MWVTLCLTLRMSAPRSLKSGNVVVMLQGRHAGKKAVIVRQVRARRFRGAAGAPLGCGLSGLRVGVRGKGEKPLPARSAAAAHRSRAPVAASISP